MTAEQSKLFPDTYAAGWNSWVNRCGCNPHAMGTAAKAGPEAGVWEAGWLDARQVGATKLLNVGQRPERVGVLKLPSNGSGRKRNGTKN